jgi:nucleolar GTP-binding protein
VLTDLCT